MSVDLEQHYHGARVVRKTERKRQSRIDKGWGKQFPKTITNAPGEVVTMVDGGWGIRSEMEIGPSFEVNCISTSSVRPSVCLFLVYVPFCMFEWDRRAENLKSSNSSREGERGGGHHIRRLYHVYGVE